MGSRVTELTELDLTPASRCALRKAYTGMPRSRRSIAWYTDW